MPLVHAGQRALWLVCACALLIVPRAGAAESSTAADFDGDGRRDQAAIDQREPSVLYVWLSKTDTIDVIRSSRPLLRVVATDLDGDHRSELIATDASTTGLLIWKKDARRGFRAYHPRRSLPRATTPSGGCAADDDSADPADALPEPPYMRGPLDSKGCLSVPVTDGLILAAQSDRALASGPSLALSAPRPPPSSIG